ncbi:MAG: ubiquinone/menaquinone biosynthesis methyltransferase, partial [Calditrichaeota bacterium]
MIEDRSRESAVASEALNDRKITPSRREVWRMFDRISPRYDLLNRLLSLRQDVFWRKKLASHLPEQSSLTVLDLATGTADVLLSLFRHSHRLGQGIGIDMAREMMSIGREKVLSRNPAPPVYLFPADAIKIPLAENSVDAVTMAFGIRNLLDVPAGLIEMRRVLKPEGRILILEFSLPEVNWLRTLYLFYFRKILPRIGGLISGDPEAYRYLNQTV